MTLPKMKIAILGLSITSSWGNGHATTYRGLVRELSALGHEVLFLERDVEWYAGNRDLPSPPYCVTELYSSLRDLKNRFSGIVTSADVVIVGSYVPEGIAVCEWVTGTAAGITAFYDIDTPITLAHLDSGTCEYVSPELIPRFDLYLSFTGGPILDKLEKRYGARRSRALYCSVDPELYFPETLPMKWDMGYLGTFSIDRQPTLDLLMGGPARTWEKGRFVVAGPMYPETVVWPLNVERVYHLAPREHRRFYNSQRYTLNVTRADMVKAGYSPSVRLFEAAACGIPIISDYWEGLESFFQIGQEILVARTSAECLDYLINIPESERKRIGARAMARVLSFHTARHRAVELETFIIEAAGDRSLVTLTAAGELH